MFLITYILSIVFPVYYSSPHFFHWVFWYFNKFLWALCILEIVTFVMYYNFFNFLTNFVLLNNCSHWLHSQILLPLSLSLSLCWHSHQFPLLLGLSPNFFLIFFLHVSFLPNFCSKHEIDWSVHSALQWFSLGVEDSPHLNQWENWVFKLPVTQTLDNHSHS